MLADEMRTPADAGRHLELWTSELLNLELVRVLGPSRTGCGQSQTAVSNFVLRLERTELFDQVKLIGTSRRPFLSGSAVEFQVECFLAEAGGEANEA